MPASPENRPNASSPISPALSRRQFLGSATRAAGAIVAASSLSALPVFATARKASVGPGDVLFLPRKQRHSVQCTSPDGFDVVGVIYPGDNPAIDF